jgi:hypothetical protein
MSKEDWIWVAIRIFGIYLVVLTITAIPRFVSTSLNLYYNQSYKKAVITDYGAEGNVTKDNEVGDMMRTVYTTSVTTFAGCIVKLVLFASLGVYFLKGGKLIFRLVCPPNLKESIT